MAIPKRTRYFAGICWKRVQAMQEIASLLVMENEEED